MTLNNHACRHPALSRSTTHQGLLRYTTHRKRETVAVVIANNAFVSCKASESFVHRLNHELKLSLLSLAVYATRRNNTHTIAFRSKTDCSICSVRHMDSPINSTGIAGSPTYHCGIALPCCPRPSLFPLQTHIKTDPLVPGRQTDLRRYSSADFVTNDPFQSWRISPGVSRKDEISWEQL
jgi:hypothetical protein